MSKPAAKPAAKKAASGPSYESMIKEAIIAHPEESRSGLSRPTIKKFIQKKYPDTGKVPEASFNNHISKAIAKGAEKKIFSLPKGPSGKVKLAAEAKKPAAKKPVAKKKPAVKKVVKKTTTTAKKPAAKKTKSSTAVKAKAPAAKKTAKTATKKAAPKKAAAKKA